MVVTAVTALLVRDLQTLEMEEEGTGWVRDGVSVEVIVKGSVTNDQVLATSSDVLVDDSCSGCWFVELLVCVTFVVQVMNQGCGMWVSVDNIGSGIPVSSCVVNVDDVGA